MGVGGGSSGAVAPSRHNNTTVMMGILFMVLSSLVQTGQFVAVESMLKRGGSDTSKEEENAETPVHPYTACALQGFWGTVFCCAVVLPTSGFFGGESWADDISMLMHSPGLLTIC